MGASDAALTGGMSVLGCGVLHCANNVICGALECSERFLQVAFRIRDAAKANDPGAALTAYDAAVVEGIPLRPESYNSLLYLCAGGEHWAMPDDGAAQQQQVPISFLPVIRLCRVPRSWFAEFGSAFRLKARYQPRNCPKENDCHGVHPAQFGCDVCQLTRPSNCTCRQQTAAKGVGTAPRHLQSRTWRPDMPEEPQSSVPWSSRVRHQNL